MKTSRASFFEHFVYIAHAMNDLGGEGISLWDERTVFTTTFCICRTASTSMQVRSMVGLIPLVRSRDARVRCRGYVAGIQAAHAVVHRQ